MATTAEPSSDLWLWRYIFHAKAPYVLQQQDYELAIGKMQGDGYMT